MLCSEGHLLICCSSPLQLNVCGCNGDSCQRTMWMLSWKYLLVYRTDCGGMAAWSVHSAEVLIATFFDCKVIFLCGLQLCDKRCNINNNGQGRCKTYIGRAAIATLSLLMHPGCMAPVSNLAAKSNQVVSPQLIMPALSKRDFYVLHKHYIICI